MQDLDELRKAYEERFGFAVAQTDAEGRVVAGESGVTDCSCRNENDDRRLQAASQTLYWGDTVISLCCEDGYAIWGVPIRRNSETIGTLLVQGVDLESSENGLHRKTQEAANGLLEMALEANLIHPAEIQLARQRTLREQDRFLAIEAAKNDFASNDLRSIYLKEEPELLVAIKEGRLSDARSILNRILTGIYSLAGNRMAFLKSCVLELVVMMSRAAIEAGAEPASVLGTNYRSLVELSDIEDEEELSVWVRRMLETLIDGIRRNDAFPHSLLLLRAVKYMQNHLHEHLRRDDVARIAGISPSHFSKLVTERMGRSFSHLLSQMRVNRAKELLSRTDRSLTEIAMECGFYDQSHFNKAFRSIVSESPGEYRKRLK